MAKHLSNAGTSSSPPGKVWDTYVATLAPNFWYKLSDSSTPTALDSADSNNGLYNTPYPTLGEASIIPGTTDTCALFVTTPNCDMYADGIDVSLAGWEEWTLVVAVKATAAAGSYQGICALNTDSASDYLAGTSIMADTSGKAFYVMYDDEVPPEPFGILGPSSIMDGSMHLLGISVVVLSGYFHAYQDGANVGRSAFATVSQYNRFPTAGFATLGTTGTPFYYYWPGYLQSFLVFDRALSDAEMLGLWTAATA